MYDFATDLRALRAGAGAFTYRELSRRAGYSASALSAAAAGEMLPTLPVTLAYVGACKGDQQQWQQRWQDLADLLRRTDPGLISTVEETPEPSEVPLPSEVPPPSEVPAVSDEPAASAPLAAADGGQGGAPLVEVFTGAQGTPVVAALRVGDPQGIGGYTLVGRLGSGSMGLVYLGRRDRDGVLAAVKVVRPELADDVMFRRRFQRELHTLREVDDPHIAVLLDADGEAVSPWLATAYTPAVTLQHAVDVAGPLPPSTVRGLVTGLAEALTALHTHGVVHRDLKPSNVLLCADGPRLIDFGIARVFEGTGLTATGVHLGSAAFMAPEQATGAAVGTPADMFAFGALINYAVTGRPPFGEGAPAAVLYRVVHTDPDLEQLLGVDPVLHDLAARSLTKDPQTRPTAADALRTLATQDPAPAPAGGWLPAEVAALIPTTLTPATPGEETTAGSGVIWPAVLAPVAADPVVVAPVVERPVGWRRPVVRLQFGLAPLVLVAAIIVALLVAGRHGGTNQIVLAPPTTSPGPVVPGGPDPVTGTSADSAPAATSAAAGTSTAAPAAPSGSTAGPRAAAAGPTGRPGVVARQARYGFEDGVAPWGYFWNSGSLTVTSTTAEAFDGSHALLLDASARTRSAAFGTTHIAGLNGGDTVTFHVWYGGQGQGQLIPFAQDTGFATHWAATKPLSLPAAAGWSTYAWQVPNVAVHGIGFQLDNTGSGDLVIAFDAVDW